jgi:hypothetical protein
VPSDRITTLYNADATRDNIKAKLRALVDDDMIQPGDPILIFFAGHGATAPAPKGWPTAGDSIQMLVPHDFDPTGKSGGLHDFNLNFLLREIASAKGNNIVRYLSITYAVDLI